MAGFPPSHRRRLAAAPVSGRSHRDGHPMYRDAAEHIPLRYDNFQPEVNIASPARDFLILAALDIFIEFKRRVGAVAANPIRRMRGNWTTAWASRLCRASSSWASLPMASAGPERASSVWPASTLLPWTSRTDDSTRTRGCEIPRWCPWKASATIWKELRSTSLPAASC